MLSFLFKVGQRITRGDDIYIVKEAADNSYLLYSPSSRYTIQSAKNKVEKEFKSLDDWEKQLADQYQKALDAGLPVPTVPPKLEQARGPRKKGKTEDDDEPGELIFEKGKPKMVENPFYTTEHEAFKGNPGGAHPLITEIQATKLRKEWAHQTPTLIGLVNKATGLTFIPDKFISILTDTPRTLDDGTQTGVTSSLVAAALAKVVGNLQLQKYLHNKDIPSIITKMRADEFSEYRDHPLYKALLSKIEATKFNEESASKNEAAKAKFEKEVAEKEGAVAAQQKEEIGIVLDLQERLKVANEILAEDGAARKDPTREYYRLYANDLEKLTKAREALITKWKKL